MKQGFSSKELSTIMWKSKVCDSIKGMSRMVVIFTSQSVDTPHA